MAIIAVWKSFRFYVKLCVSSCYYYTGNIFSSDFESLKLLILLNNRQEVFLKLLIPYIKLYNIKLYKNSEFLIFQKYIFAVHFQDFLNFFFFSKYTSLESMIPTGVQNKFFF